MGINLKYMFCYLGTLANSPVTTNSLTLRIGTTLRGARILTLEFYTSRSRSTLRIALALVPASGNRGAVIPRQTSAGRHSVHHLAVGVGAAGAGMAQLSYNNQESINQLGGVLRCVYRDRSVCTC